RGDGTAGLEGVDQKDRLLSRNGVACLPAIAGRGGALRVHDQERLLAAWNPDTWHTVTLSLTAQEDAFAGNLMLYRFGLPRHQRVQQALAHRGPVGDRSVLLLCAFDPLRGDL